MTSRQLIRRALLDASNADDESIRAGALERIGDALEAALTPAPSVATPDARRVVTDAMVEAGAIGLFAFVDGDSWELYAESTKNGYRQQAKAVLTAALAATTPDAQGGA